MTLGQPSLSPVSTSNSQVKHPTSPQAPTEVPPNSQGHADELRRPPVCRVQGCINYAWRNGYCRACYQRENPNPQEKINYPRPAACLVQPVVTSLADGADAPPCKVDGCTGRAVINGYCLQCYQRDNPNPENKMKSGSEDRSLSTSLSDDKAKVSL